MNKIDDGKLCDILIGEAVIELLGDKARISRHALLTRLQAKLESEKDDQRRRAVALAIKEVGSEMASPDARSSGQRDNGARITRKVLSDDDQTRH